MDIQSAAPANMCTSKVTLAAGSTTTLSSTGTILFSIRGKAYSHAALSNTATPTVDANTGAAFTGVVANKGSVFVVGFNAAGTLKVAQGSIVDLDASGNFIVAPQFPDLPTDFAPVGYILVKADSTANATTGWIFGTSNLSSVTGVSWVFQDLMTLPDRPQTA